MKKLLIIIALLITPFYAIAGVNVAVTLGHPNFYGQLELGGFAPPPVMYARPIVIRPVPPGVVYQPIYLRVPRNHYHHWSRYCGRYNACGRPVYFVNDGWYRHTYAPRYRHDHYGYGR